MIALKIIFGLIVLIATTMFHRYFREQQRRKATPTKDDLMSSFTANWQEDYALDAKIRETEAVCTLFLAADDLLKARVRDTHRIIALEQAVKNFKILHQLP